MKKPKIAIIGGGAAGLMATASILEQDSTCELHLFEKNPSLGAKVIISGGGRCNVTTGITDKKTLFSKYTRGARFLQTAIGKFPPESVRAWFEEHGVPLKEEADQRVFPKSDNGRDVVGVFEKLFENHQVHQHLKTAVDSLQAQGAGILLKTKESETLFDAVIITTGGNAYQHTGSTGDGYSFAKAIGHTITPLGPSLNSFMTAEAWPKDLSGISLPHAVLSAKTHEEKKVSTEGPLLFTHFGISGPAVFALSSHLAFRSVSEKEPISMQLKIDQEKTAQDWQEILREPSEQQLQNSLKKYLPNRLTKPLLEACKINPEKKASELSDKERTRLAEYLGGQLQLNLIKRRPGDEFVTAGGVTQKEVDPKTMQSRLDPRVFFAGEIIDVDGVTGGFNLQASWATGRLAGKSILERIMLS